MSEDVKPRKFEIFYSGLSGTFKVRNNYHAYIMIVKNTNGDEYPDDEYIKVIELEPTLQLMKEMSDAFNKINEAKKMFMQFRDAMYVEVIDKESKDALEKYRKFLEGIQK